MISLLTKLFHVYFICVSVLPTHLCAPYACLGHREFRKGVRSLGTGVSCHEGAGSPTPRAASAPNH